MGGKYTQQTWQQKEQTVLTPKHVAQTKGKLQKIKCTDKKYASIVLSRDEISNIGPTYPSSSKDQRHSLLQQIITSKELGYLRDYDSFCVMERKYLQHIMIAS